MINSFLVKDLIKTPSGELLFNFQQNDGEIPELIDGIDNTVQEMLEYAKDTVRFSLKEELENMIQPTFRQCDPVIILGCERMLLAGYVYYLLYIENKIKAKDSFAVHVMNMQDFIAFPKKLYNLANSYYPALSDAMQNIVTPFLYKLLTKDFDEKDSIDYNFNVTEMYKAMYKCGILLGLHSIEK